MCLLDHFLSILREYELIHICILIKEALWNLFAHHLINLRISFFLRFIWFYYYYSRFLCFHMQPFFIQTNHWFCESVLLTEIYWLPVKAWWEAISVFQKHAIFFLISIIFLITMNLLNRFVKLVQILSIQVFQVLNDRNHQIKWVYLVNSCTLYFIWFKDPKFSAFQVF